VQLISANTGSDRECPMSIVKRWLVLSYTRDNRSRFTSKLREKEYVPSQLEVWCVRLSSCSWCDWLCRPVCVCLSGSLLLKWGPPSPFIILRGVRGYMCLCYNVVVLIWGVGQSMALFGGKVLHSWCCSWLWSWYECSCCSCRARSTL
jgi:hypothetical protein